MSLREVKYLFIEYIENLVKLVDSIRKIISGKKIVFNSLWLNTTKIYFSFTVSIQVGGL